MITDKTAIVTGISGMDGSLLADSLIADGIKVYGMIRRSSRGLDLGCAEHLQNNPLLEVVEGDLADLSSLVRLCSLAKADYYYNAASQSHVATSFSQPTYTSQITGLGVLNCLEAIRLSGYHTRFLQFSTSEMFGGMSSEPANEETPFHPRSPYGVAKLFGYWTTINYREAYKMFASNIICFNHECGRRGPNFVTRKITMAVAKIKMGLQDKLALGNLEAKRDWGWAPDYIEGARTVLEEANRPGDYVLATGEAHSVREFCEAAFSHVGLDYNDYVVVDPQYYRPCEVDVLVGDASKAYNRLGWSPRCSFKDLVKNMVDHDLRLLSS